MNSVVETITPQKAQEYLSTSVDENGVSHNRPISKVTVRSYCDTIKAGKWVLNGIPIVFDINGKLIDGQHRLNAIISAGIPIETVVARGVDERAFTTFDCGLHRSLGQLLAMQQKKNYNTVGSVVSSSECLRKYGTIWPNSSLKEQKRTNQDGYEIYMRDSEGYDDAGAVACDIYQHGARTLNKSWIGGIYYYLTKVGGYSKEHVKDFFEQLCGVCKSDNNGIELLRVRMIQEDRKGKDTKTKSSVLFALIVKAWNAYVTGKKVSMLKYNAEVEKEYPKFILLQK